MLENSWDKFYFLMNSTCQLDSVCLVVEKAMYDEEQWDSFFCVCFLPFEQRVGSCSFERSHHVSFDYCNLCSLLYLLNVPPPPCSWSSWCSGSQWARGREGAGCLREKEPWIFSSSAFGKPDIPWPCVNSPMLFSLHRPLFSVWKKELRMIQN